MLTTGIRVLAALDMNSLDILFPFPKTRLNQDLKKKK